MSNVAYVDTETTSLNPETGEVYEVGLITPDGQEHHWWLPVTLEHADEMSLKVGRFHERHPQGNAFPRPCGCRAASDDESLFHFHEHVTCSLARFAPAFARHTHGMHLAGAVVNFDTERLWRLLRRQGVMPSWHYHLIDVEALVAGRLSIPPPWSSNDLSLAIGVDPSDFARHTAIGDCQWAKALYEAVVR